MKEPMIKFDTIDDYIASFPEETQLVLRKVREVIKKEAPEAKEKISYGMPAYALNGNLVYFAAAKNHIGFYPTPSAITAFREDLAEYEYSKGAVQFPKNKPIPYDLISRMVQFRVKENLGKKAKS